MAEGGSREPLEESGCHTVPMEERSRIHTERLVSNRSREAERKISFPERGFRPATGRPAVAVADQFGEHEEEAEAERVIQQQQDELVQARNPHPIAAAEAGFVVRQESDNPVRYVTFYQPDLR